MTHLKKSLSEWLVWQESLNPKEIELGLERCFQVAKKTDWLKIPPFKIITVAGTNGKGSSVAMLASIYQQAGYKVGCYTSPHLIDYNERVKINKQNVTDEQLVKAFERIDLARAEVTLTYFEFGTLAAMDVFYSEQPDIVILETGLGGRLDAVNIFDSDVCLITHIALDHTDWLGGTIEDIGREKAGIFREGKAAVCCDVDLPESVYTVAQQKKTPLFQAGTDFQVTQHEKSWDWTSTEKEYTELPVPAINGDFQIDNAAAVLMVVEQMQFLCPVDEASIRKGLMSVHIEGRLQRLDTEPEIILDVSHNPDATYRLAEYLKANPVKGENIAIVGMLSDKDHQKSLLPFKGLIEYWFLADIAVPRGGKAIALEKIIHSGNIEGTTRVFRTIDSAWNMAKKRANINDRLVVFGSFYMVSTVLKNIH